MNSDTVFASLAIGAAASLAGMIWPFRRGFVGVAINLLAGIIGALVADALSFVVLPEGTHGNAPARLVFASVGALAALAAVHVAATRIGAIQRRNVGIGKAPPRP